jgi:putative transport protein
MLELGDRVRVLTSQKNMPAVAAYFGDSYRALSEIDILSFSLGLALGMVLGLIPFPLPGGVTVKLGLAGGPLIMALVLGRVGHTGRINWCLPYNGNLMLRQVGLVLFLAGIGTRAGFDFYRTLVGGGGWPLLVAALVIVSLTGVLTLWIGHKVLKMPMGLLTGMLAGLQTQPATLGFALEQAGNELPNIGYARVFPVAAVAKILAAQVIVTLFT